MKNILIRSLLIALTSLTGYKVHAHSLPLNKMAVKACQEKTRSQTCQYSGHHDDLYIGTCQFASEKKLICVRNKPIQSHTNDTVILETGKQIESSQEHNQQM